MDHSELSRRDFQKLALAALSGAMAGAGIAGQAQAADKKEENPLLTDKHVCRGINTCKGKGADKKNACAGQGTCAIAKAHTCHFANDCKGQGGCGEKPGENACKGKGECAVPLSDKAWKKARARFEELMTKAGKKFGKAPPKKK
jgi:hypothetical protein